MASGFSLSPIVSVVVDIPEGNVILFTSDALLPNEHYSRTAATIGCKAHTSI
jgi:hypothetical protein